MLQGETAVADAVYYENFSTEDVPENCTKLLWEVEGPQAGSVSFDIMEDKTFWPDPTHFTGVRDGLETEVIRDSAFYIARPEDADDEAFTVTVYALVEE